MCRTFFLGNAKMWSYFLGLSAAERLLNAFVGFYYMGSKQWYLWAHRNFLLHNLSKLWGQQDNLSNLFPSLQGREGMYHEIEGREKIKIYSFPHVPARSLLWVLAKVNTEQLLAWLTDTWQSFCHQVLTLLETCILAIHLWSDAGASETSRTYWNI